MTDDRDLFTHTEADAGEYERFHADAGDDRDVPDDADLAVPPRRLTAAERAAVPVTPDDFRTPPRP